MGHMTHMIYLNAIRSKSMHGVSPNLITRDQNQKKEHVLV